MAVLDVDLNVTQIEYVLDLGDFQGEGSSEEYRYQYRDRELPPIMLVSVGVLDVDDSIAVTVTDDDGNEVLSVDVTSDSEFEYSIRTLKDSVTGWYACSCSGSGGSSGGSGDLSKIESSVSGFVRGEDGSANLEYSSFYNGSGVRALPVVSRVSVGVYEVDFTRLRDYKGNLVSANDAYASATVESSVFSVAPLLTVITERDTSAGENRVLFGFAETAESYVDTDFLFKVSLYTDV